MPDENEKTTLFVPVVLTEEQATMLFNAGKLMWDGMPPMVQAQCAPLLGALMELAESIEKARDKAGSQCSP